MLPGKPYGPEDVVVAIRRRIWWLVVPLAVVSAGTAIGARRLPNMYSSEATVQVVPQRVPETYVRPTLNIKLQDRLLAIEPLILSRARLEQIIAEFNLYADERASGALMEDLVIRMKRDLRVGTVRTDVFRVAYVGRNPETVRRVADRLAELFINENQADRANMADGTSEFLAKELADAKQRLQQTEARLEAFKRTYAGELPTQLQSNLAQLQATRSQMTQLAESLDRDLDRRMALESNLADLRAATTDVRLLPMPGGVTAMPPGSTASQLAQARDVLRSLETRGYKPGHPDLQAAARKVRDLEDKLDQERGAQPTSLLARGASPAEVERQRRINEIEQQLKDLAMQVAGKQQDEARLRKQAAEFQSRVDAVPSRESELTELTRDYGTYQKQYDSLMAKNGESRLAANLERLQIGETFRLLDQAKAAERPISPNRSRINLMGLGAGLAMGVLLVGFLEYRDTTLKSEADVTSVLGLPVVAVVPVMESTLDHRRALQRRILRNLGLGSTVAGCAVVLAYAFLR